jgi:hypothetical protein
MSAIRVKNSPAFLDPSKFLSKHNTPRFFPPRRRMVSSRTLRVPHRRRENYKGYIHHSNKDGRCQAIQVISMRSVWLSASLFHGNSNQ